METSATTIQTKAKMSGYLEKKSKMRMVSSWKKYWFVLEDRLLLFYRSKDEYEAISPCKGSINLSPPCTIKSYPSVQHAFQIVTRATSFTMRAETSLEQKKWMQTIMLALQQDQITQNRQIPKKLNHFRYSLDDLVPEIEPRPQFDRSNSDLITRIQKIGGKSYGGSLETINKKAITCHHTPTTTINEEECNKIRIKNKSLSNDNLKNENFYERISTGSECYSKIIQQQQQQKPRLYEKITGRTQSLIVDNENYSVPLKKCNSLRGEKTKSLFIDNVYYSGCDLRQKNNIENDEEVIYAEPNIDHNENSLLIDNVLYSGCDNKPENVYEDVADLKQSISKKKKQPKKDTDIDLINNKPNKIKKSRSFIKRLWSLKKDKNVVRNEEEEETEAIYDEVDPKGLEKFTLNDTSTVQMLSELAQILEAKKPTKLVSEPDKKSNMSCENMQGSESDKKSPPLPAKTIKPSPTNTVKTNSESDHEQARSLDEILEDLDRETTIPPQKTKIKQLIEKFDGDYDKNNIILRNNNQFIKNYSDNLDYLLEELAKITQAPILSPHSLINPEIIDEQIAKLVPKRQRRLSEPDYDVPRPLIFKQPQPPEETTESLDFSITPDSLEINNPNNPINHNSYNSHLYIQDLKCFSQQNCCFNNNNNSDKIIYAVPKSYVSVATHIVNTCQNICSAELAADEHTIVYKTVKNIVTDESDEIFVDSLELNETLTKF